MNIMQNTYTRNWNACDAVYRPSGERLFISTKTEILAINLSYFWRYTCLPHVTNNHHLKIPLIPFHLFVCSKKMFLLSFRWPNSSVLHNILAAGFAICSKRNQ